MISFKKEKTIDLYSIKGEDTKNAIAIIKEILNAEQVTKSEKIGMIYTDYGNYKKYKINYIEYGIEMIRNIPDYEIQSCSKGTIVTTQYLYPAPYTLALAAQSFNFGSYNYSNILRKNNVGSSLVNVLHGAQLDELSLLLSCFNNNIEALNIFLKNYHPDLLYLRRYLECISFNKMMEYSLEDVNDEERVIATKNTEVVKKLNLALKLND